MLRNDTPQWNTRQYAVSTSFVYGCALLFIMTIGCDLPVVPPPDAATAPEPEYADANEGDPLPEGKTDPAARTTTQDEKVKPKEQASKNGDTKIAIFAPEDDQTKDDQPEDTGAKREVVKAKPGAGRWKAYKPGFVTTPLNAYFSTKERIAYLQLEDGLKKFNALNGRNPKDFAEMEKEVLKPRQIKLPRLDPGDEYIYLPKKGRHGEIVIMRAEK